MANIPIVDKTGKEVGQYEIDTTELADKVTKQLLHDAVVMYRNNLRQGSVVLTSPAAKRRCIVRRALATLALV